MAKLKIKNCQQCGGKATMISPLTWTKTKPNHNIECGYDYVPGCGLVLYGASGVSKEEMTRRWNAIGKN